MQEVNKVKGSVLGDVVGIMLVIVITFVVFTQAIPRIISTIGESVSKISAENVGRQLSGLITISGAAAREIRIDYIPTTDQTYNTGIKSRTIKVKPNFKMTYAENASSTQPFAIDLIDYDQNNVNHFIIQKKFYGESVYVFGAKKE